MLGWFNTPEKRRIRALRQASHAVMKAYLSKPFLSDSISWKSAPIVSLDFETTGLNPAEHRILSYGCVEIFRGAIQLGSAAHQLVQSETAIPESSAVIHRITDDAASSGRPLDEILPALLDRLSGKILLVHYKPVETGFLDAACRALYDSPFVIPTIDTLELAQRLLKRRNYQIQPGRLRLFNLRDDFGLPRYSAHNALYDAITTAELFLALTAEMSPKTELMLGDLLSR